MVPLRTAGNHPVKNAERILVPGLLMYVVLFRHGFLLTGYLVAVHRVHLLGCREQVFKGLGCFGGI